jgi:uncharacterized protein (TIGR00730 family)
MTLEVNDEKVTEAIHQLMEMCSDEKGTLLNELVTQLIQTSLKLLVENHDAGQMKLITRALKEMRYAYRIFNQYKSSRVISIFGSARTPEDHPDYHAAKDFSNMMAQQGWMCITGAANGIMKAGIEGSQKEASFGLSIKLPKELDSNPVIAGDPKLIIFRYFFTRKLMFMSHSDAVAAFPGGFGTLDELFEVLTLMQTGKAPVIPVVLLEGEKGEYWQKWEEYVQKQLMGNGWISPEDKYLYFRTSSIEEGSRHIMKFYSRYHSQRYVKDKLVLRLKTSLTPEQLDLLNDRFSALVQSGKMELCSAFPEEQDHLDLPRLAFTHTHRGFGLVRALIDQLNHF